VGVGSIGAETHRRLATLLREDLLPLCPTLLSDEDPIPLYALKLLGGALEADREMCTEVWTDG
jgi:serine/threonine-protein kinase ULK4